MHSPASSMDPNFPKNYAMSTDLEGSRSFIMPSKYKVVQTKVQTSSLWYQIKVVLNMNILGVCFI